MLFLGMEQISSSLPSSHFFVVTELVSYWNRATAVHACGGHTPTHSPTAIHHNLIGALKEMPTVSLAVEPEVSSYVLLLRKAV